jgi:hypothetical protein
MSVAAFEASDHAVADSSAWRTTCSERALARHGIRRSLRLVVPEFMVLPLIIEHSDLLVVMRAAWRISFARAHPAADPSRCP